MDSLIGQELTAEITNALDLARKFPEEGRPKQELIDGLDEAVKKIADRQLDPATDELCRRIRRLLADVTQSLSISAFERRVLIYALRSIHSHAADRLSGLAALPSYDYAAEGLSGAHELRITGLG